MRSYNLSHQFTKLPSVMRCDPLEYINYEKGLLWQTLVDCVVFPLDGSN